MALAVHKDTGIKFELSFPEIDIGPKPKNLVHNLRFRFDREALKFLYQNFDMIKTEFLKYPPDEFHYIQGDGLESILIFGKIYQKCFKFVELLKKEPWIDYTCDYRVRICKNDFIYFSEDNFYPTIFTEHTPPLKISSHSIELKGERGMIFHNIFIDLYFKSLDECSYFSLMHPDIIFSIEEVDLEG